MRQSRSARAYGGSGAARVTAVLVLAYLFGAPFVLLALPGPEWVNRMFAMGAVLVPLTVGIIFYGCFGRILGPNAPLDDARLGGARLPVLLALRAAIVAVGLVLASRVTLPFLADAATIVAGNDRVTFSADVMRVRSARRAATFVMRTLSVRRAGETAWTPYRLWFSFQPIRPGRYGVTVLPRSHSLLALEPAP